MREVVEHISHDQFFSYLAKFTQILNPGGVLVLSTPNPWAGGTVFAYDYTHISPWNMRDMYSVLRCYDFQPVEIYRIIWPSRVQWLKKAYRPRREEASKAPPLHKKLLVNYRSL